MADLTASLVDVCEYLFTLLDTNKESLGLMAVYYGDQDRLPMTPVACIEPDTKNRDLKGAQRMTAVTLRAYVLVYHSAITSPQQNRRDADQMAEDIETLIHSKRSLDGLLIHGMVTAIESGYVTRERTLVRSSRLTYEGLSQQLLPSTN